VKLQGSLRVQNMRERSGATLLRTPRTEKMGGRKIVFQEIGGGRGVRVDTCSSRVLWFRELGALASDGCCPTADEMRIFGKLCEAINFLINLIQCGGQRRLLAGWVGRMRWMVAPWPRELVAQMQPPCCWTMEWQMARPGQFLPWSGSEASTCWKRSNICSSLDGSGVEDEVDVSDSSWSLRPRKTVRSAAYI
jgi:hypothetical protein